MRRKRRKGLKTSDAAALVLTVATVALVLVKWREYKLSNLRQEVLLSETFLEDGESDDPRHKSSEYDFEIEDSGESAPTRKRWRSAPTRAGTHHVDPPKLPPLDDLVDKIFITKDKLKDVFVTKENYDKLLYQYAQEGRQFLKAKRFFPSVDSDFLSSYNFSSCAVVGNSGTLLNSSFGSAIDSHSAVWRINQAPTNKRFEKHVGKKSTIRLINMRWTNKYGDPRFLFGEKDAPGSKGVGLPLEQNVTLVSTRSKPQNFDRMAELLRALRTDVRFLYLSSRVVSQARRLLVGYRVLMEEANPGEPRYFGGSTPSSGFLALFASLQMCDHVTAYGFGLDSENGVSQRYHYFNLFSEGERKKTMNPTHSFDAERDLMRALGKEKYILYCGYVARDRRHNKRCGHRHPRQRKTRRDKDKAPSEAKGEEEAPKAEEEEEEELEASPLSRERV